MLRFQRGDERAFDEIVERHRGWILDFAWRSLGDREAAEDAAQEVLVKVYAARDRYRPDAKFRTWLYRIAANLCINMGEKIGRRRALSLDRVAPASEEPMGAAVPDPRGDPPGESLEREELKVRLRSALNEIPERQRVALVLNKYDDLSYEEVGEILSLTVPAVKSLLHRARLSLLEKLKPFL